MEARFGAKLYSGVRDVVLKVGRVNGRLSQEARQVLQKQITNNGQNLNRSCNVDLFPFAEPFLAF